MPTDQLRLLPRGRRARGRARRALDETLGAWRATGAIERADNALLALARITADQLDAACADDDESRYVTATLAGRHHAVLLTLYDRHALDAGPSLGDVLAAMGDPAQP